MKKVCAIMIAAGFLFTAFPMMAGAAQPSYRQKLMEQSIAGLQQKIYAEDSSALSAITIQFLDDILAAGLKNNKADLQLAVARYAADVQEIQAIDNATKCGLSFGISSGSAAAGMITEVTSGDSAFCMVNNLTNKVADIMVANCKYNICLIDTTSSYTGTKTRAEWVQQQKGIAIYNFATSATNVFLCTEAPTAQSYISLLFDFIAILTVK